MADKLIFEFEVQAKLDKAMDGINDIKEGTEQINENLEGIKKSGKVAEKGLKGIAKGFKGIGLAMKAGGFFLITEAFKFLKDIMSKNQRVMDVLTIATESLGIVFNSIASVVTDLGEKIFGAFSNPKEAVTGLWDAIKENIINRFEGFIDQFKALGKVIEGVFSLDWDKVKEGAGDYATALVQVVTGLDEVQQADAWETIKEGAKDFVEMGSEAVKTATEITKLRNSVKILEAEQGKLMFTYLREQELQRQIRDDVSKTFEERMEANDKLGESLQEQLEVERGILLEKLRLAQMESDANKENIDLKAEVINAEKELADLNERITGFESEQIVNRVALEQESAEALKELKLAEMSEKEAEFEALKQEHEARLDLARRAGADATLIEEQYLADKQAITQKYLDEETAAKEKADAEQEKSDKAANDAMIASRKARMDGLKGAISMAEGLFGKSEKDQKRFALAKIGIDTAEAISSLTANSEANPTNAVTFGGAGALQFAMGLLRIYGNIRSAKKLLEGGSEEPSAASSSTGSASASMTTPNTIEAPSFDLSASTGIFEQQPLQAYVVQQDIQEQNELNTQIQERATL